MAAAVTVPMSDRTPKTTRALPSALWPWLLLLPAFLSLASVSFYPIVNGVYLSFTNRSLITQDNDFIGIANYVQLLADPPFWNAWWHTIWFTVASTTLETLIGLAMALILCEAFAGRGVIRAAMLVPWAMPTVVTSKMFGWLFDGQHGIINFILLHLGLIDQNVNWYGSPDTALTTIILADVWKTTPFMALLLLTGLQTVPKSLIEAARMDGARAWTIFWNIRLPLLLPTLLIAGLFRALDAFRVFDLVYVLTGGGPADSTETLSTLSYKVLFSTLQFGYGSAVSTAMFITEGLIAVVFCLFLVRQIRKTT
ncbi:sugar ABC transporter permease [Agrobacterium rhizogenes]|uniref:Trehalosemaltose ABC transporter n=3 Tax=Rhizobium/Agrobacterium group TaxID=227290 RepID=B9JL41_RHIR8|nr:trehalosemaltose ABC transporter [Rhizobium rhizogenes K84]EJK78914.1 permease component of ABC-type sugar transporter [Rhizobium sp. AP16]KAA6488811.1 sugar ABC transporter permease [Agrobacterium sp. ICMP 7243]KEA08633.1 ABC transporter permease [Rhizobium rhizogenes]OCJ01583.1 ABC transporter permease [Agrobacterium sp. 13-626]OCJ15972.1 ABC transporter permease [Agrobacterium sp. B131/95]OCJ19296.1 ABC transporter permease [Agrobacterium sp. B133/95]GAJ95346.1 putative ABC transporter